MAMILRVRLSAWMIPAIAAGWRSLDRRKCRAPDPAVTARNVRGEGETRCYSDFFGGARAVPRAPADRLGTGTRHMTRNMEQDTARQAERNADADTRCASAAAYAALTASLYDAFCVVADVRRNAAGRCTGFRYLDANPACVALTGRAAGAAWSPSDAGPERAWCDAVGRVARGGAGERFESRLADGASCYDVHVFPVPGGCPAGAVGVLCRDISARKKEEGALRESRERKAFLLRLMDSLRTLADPLAMQCAAARVLREHLRAAAVVFWDARGDGEFAAAGAAYVDGAARHAGRCRMADHDAAPAAELRLGRIVARTDARADALLSDAHRAAFGVDGEHAWAIVPFAKDGRLLGMLSVLAAGPHAWRRRELRLMQAVAERTWAAVGRARAEESLLRSEQKYRSLFDAIDEGFALIETIFDAAGRCVDYRFLEVNRAFERQTRLAGVTGRRARELVPDLEQDVIDRYGRVAVTGEPERFECCIAGMGGTWYTAYAARVGGAGSREVAVVFDDVTQRKRVERAAVARAARQAFLLELSDALRPLVQPDRVLATASRLLGRHLGVQRVVFAEFSRVGVDVRTGWADGLAPMDGYYPAGTGRSTALHAARGARLLVLRDTADARELPAGDRAAYAGDGVAALIGAGIVYHDQPVGMLVVHATAPRDWSEDDVTLVQEVAERTWAMVERARAEAARRLGETRLRRMLRIPTVGIVHFDAAGAVVQANDAFLAITGCTRAALDTGLLRYDEFAPPAWRDGDDDSSQPFERAWVRPDGRRVWILCAAARLDARTIVEFVIDVTDRRAAQEQLRESELRHRAFSSLVPVMMWETDADGRHVTPNQRWLEYTGQSVEDTRHGGWLAAIHPGDLPDARRAYADAVAGGRQLELEYRVRGADGGYRWFLVRQRPVRDPEGTIRAWYGAAIDIDARRQAEAALQESEGRFRALADAAPALIWQFRADGRLVYVNRRYAEVTGATLDRLLPDGWHAGVHPDDLPYFLTASDDAIDDRVPFHLRLRVHAAVGDWRWFEVHFAPWFARDGAYRGHVGIGIDISDGVQAEDALREADRRKDEFLAVLAHELRNPLAPISNAVEMLRCADGKRKADRVMEMASRQVKHITRLVDDLMEVSRITRGKIELARQPVALADILAGAVETSRPALDGARHAFVQHLPDERLVLDADKVRLTQVFSNLLNNAAKYTDPGGRIELRVRRDGGHALVAVRDSGIGIPPDKLGQVFGMFAQVEEAGARSQGGLGIGLAMVHKLVEMHGGSVQAKSEGRGRGSEFVVRLPLLPESALPAQEAPAAGARALAGMRVLVVDDNRDAADSLCFLLGSLGVDAHCAYGGEDALRRVPQLRPDAVVLDIGMPGMDGHAVARVLRADVRNDGMRLIALTGWGQEGDRERTRASGFDHHLTKPVDLDALQHVLLEDVRERHAAQ
jgi:PAS domain S-box-containing protein